MCVQHKIKTEHGKKVKQISHMMVSEMFSAPPTWVVHVQCFYCTVEYMEH